MIDKNRIEGLSKSLRGVIENWARENGLERTGNFNITFSEHAFRVSSTVEFVEIDAKEDVAAQEYTNGLTSLNFKRSSEGLPLIPKHSYGKVISYDDATWILREIKTRSPKFPFILENMETGGKIKASAGLVLSALTGGRQ